MRSGPDATSGSERSWIARRWMVHKSISLYRFWSFIDAPLIDYLQVHNGMNRDNKHLCETEISDKEELPSSNHEKATCYNLKLVSQSAKWSLFWAEWVISIWTVTMAGLYFVSLHFWYFIFFSKTGYSSKTHSFNLQFRDGLASTSYRRSLQMSTTPSGFNLWLDIGHGWSNWHLLRGMEPLSFKRSPCRG